METFSSRVRWDRRVLARVRAVTLSLVPYREVSDEET